MIITAAVSGVILAWLFGAGGILFQVVFGEGNLSPIIGIFVVGPIGFSVGAIAGAVAAFLRR